MQALPFCSRGGVDESTGPGSCTHTYRELLNSAANGEILLAKISLERTKPGINRCSASKKFQNGSGVHRVLGV